MISPMKIDADRLTKLFCELVAVDSPSYGERAMADLLTGKLEALGFTVTEDDAAGKLGGNAGNLIATMQGSLDLPPLLLCAHMDTVAPAFGKKAVVEPDGRIHSAGDMVLGADDLAAVAAIIEAVTALKEGNIPHRSLEVLISAAEENYCRGADALDKGMLQAKEAYILDLDAPVGTAAVSAPTVLDFQIRCDGRSSHAGFAPEKGVSAILAAANAMMRLPGGRISPDTTLNYGLIEGGTQTNIVPDVCTVRGEIRSSDDAFAFALLEQVKQVFTECCRQMGAEAVCTDRCLVHAYETPKDSPVVRRYEKVCAAMGFPVELIRTFGASDNNCLAQCGIQGIVVASAMHGCHTCDEYTTVRELTDVAAITAALLCEE